MNRARVLVLAVLIALGVLIAPAAAQAIPPVNGCAESAYFPSAPGNGLAWSYSDYTAFHTPMMRAGACRHVWVQFFGVYTAPACMYARVLTYNNDRTVRVRGPWMEFRGIGDLGDLRPTIDNMRYYRIYAYGCGSFRGPGWVPGFRVFTHAP